MPRSTRTRRVRSIPGEPLRFYVESWTSAARPHIVDLSLHGGIGECSCVNWRIVRWLLIKAGCKIGEIESRCIHVVAAREVACNQYLSNASKILHPQQP